MLPNVAGMRPARAHAHAEHLDRRLEELARPHGTRPPRDRDPWDPDEVGDVGEDEDGPGGPWRGTDPPALPVPGRHAGRRGAAAAGGRRPGLEALVPDALRGPVRLGAPHLAVVAVAVALGLALTCWWVVRADPRTVQAPSSAPAAQPDPGLEAAPDLVQLTPVAAEPGTATTPPGALAPTEASTADAVPSAAAVASGGAVASTGASAATDGGSVTVDVAGRVRRPGVVVLASGSRVVDALEAAGGARRGVGLGALNLARVLVDGEQVLVGPPPRGVPAAAALPGTTTATVPGATASSTGPATVSLNTADQATLETLPQVGPVTAQAILAWREQHGAFSAVEELLEVDGIGPATLAQIAPHATP